MVVVRILLAAAVSASASPAARESAPVEAPAAVTTSVFPPRMAHGYRTLHVPLGRLALDASR
jgi:hypothetical protein